jgi:hypothetical protein
MGILGGVLVTAEGVPPGLRREHHPHDDGSLQGNRKGSLVAGRKTEARGGGRSSGSACLT